MRDGNKELVGPEAVQGRVHACQKRKHTLARRSLHRLGANAIGSGVSLITHDGGGKKRARGEEGFGAAGAGTPHSGSGMMAHGSAGEDGRRGLDTGQRKMDGCRVAR